MDIVNEHLSVRIEADEHAVGVGIAGVVVKLEREFAPLALRRNEVLVVCGLVILVLSLLPESDVQACVVLIVRAESLRTNLNHISTRVCTHGGIEVCAVLVRMAAEGESSLPSVKRLKSSLMSVVCAEAANGTDTVIMAATASVLIVVVTFINI